jgi:hypothetical protein
VRDRPSQWGAGLAAGNDEGSAWPAFIRRLVERGLRGVRLVISDDHAGLVKAVREQLLGSSWQRCRVHFTRNAQDLVPRSARSMVASAIRLVFEQPDERAARSQVDAMSSQPTVRDRPSQWGAGAPPTECPGCGIRDRAGTGDQRTNGRPAVRTNTVRMNGAVRTNTVRMNGRPAAKPIGTSSRREPRWLRIRPDAG